VKKSSFPRYSFLGAVLTLFAVAIFVQMVRIQNSADAEVLNDWANNYGYENRTIQSERGYIYDRWGNLLAGNKEVYEVGIEIKFVMNPAAIAAATSKVLGLDYGFVFKSATNPPEGFNYITLADFITSEQIDELSQLKTQYENKNPYGADPNKPSLRGLVWSPHLQRTYPEQDLASNVLGFFTFYDRKEGAGYYGVEEMYGSLLSGVSKNVLISLDPYEMQEIPTVPPGASLVLTIDREIQAMTERIIDEAVKNNGAESGTAIIMDPTNGEILAMAVTPRMNPNEYWDYGNVFTDNTPFNRALSETYEPGSVFKVITMAAALDSGTVTPQTQFVDTGSIYVGGYYIYNWDRGAWGPQDMTGCMQHSLNVCLSWIATEMGPTRFYNYLQAFGIGRRTNLDLAGEQIWPLSLPGDKDWYEVNLATNSFGQGVATTPIQMVMAISAVANNQGIMYAPHLLQAYIQDGKQYNTPPVAVGAPIGAETAKTLTDMLAVSLESESSVALVPGYRLAGKTGTGEIPSAGGYETDLTNTSFVGWGPVDDPKFLVYVWLEKPTSDRWGSTVAAPVFSDIVKELVVLLNLPPDDTRHQLTAQ